MDAPRLLDDPQWLQAWQTLPAAMREVYFHPAWSAAAARWEGATAHGLAIRASGGELLYPFLQHPTPAFDEVSANAWFDAQTPYGYGGPIFTGQWPADERVAALRAAGELLRSRGCVAEFVRCHTHLCALDDLRAAGFKVFQVRTNIECDLALDDFTATWASGARRNLRKALSAGLTFRAGQSPQDLAVFESLYAATARRLEMSEFYRFDGPCTAALARIPGTQLVIVEDDQHRPVAAAMTLISGENAHYHLGGSDFAFQHLRPNDMLYFAMARLAQEAGCRRIIWGGGMSNDPQDSLFRFKTHFGSVQRPVYGAGRVLDSSAFEALCHGWSAKHPGREAKMFLQYRA